MDIRASSAVSDLTASPRGCTVRYLHEPPGTRDTESGSPQKRAPSMQFPVIRAFLALTLALLTTFVASPLTHDRTLALNDCLASDQYIAHELVVGFNPGQSVLELSDQERAGAIVSSFSQAGATRFSSPLLMPTGNVF